LGEAVEDGADVAVVAAGLGAEELGEIPTLAELGAALAPLEDCVVADAATLWESACALGVVEAATPHPDMRTHDATALNTASRGDELGMRLTP